MVTLNISVHDINFDPIQLLSIFVNSKSNKHFQRFKTSRLVLPDVIDYVVMRYKYKHMTVTVGHLHSAFLFDTFVEVFKRRNMLDGLPFVDTFTVLHIVVCTFGIGT